MELEKNMTSKEMQLEILSLNLLINRQSETYKLLAEEKHVDFKIIIPDKQFFFELNRPRFIQALDNLFSVALSVTSKHGQIQIVLSDKQGNANILVSCSVTESSLEHQNNILKEYSDYIELNRGIIL